MDLPAPDGDPAPGPLVVSSMQLRSTPARAARLVMAQEGGQDPDQRQVIDSWRLRKTASRLARLVAQGKGPTKTNKHKRSRCRELNQDTLFDLLLLLPVKDLCRLRAVCKPWRALTTDPLFIAWYTSTHPGPLFLVKFRGDQTHIHVVDLSGRVHKTMADTSINHTVQFTHLTLTCLATDWNRCRVLNPATGAVHILPQNPAPEHVNRVNLSNPYTLFALGRVSSTGEHKVLRMFNRPGFLDLGEQLFEVYTINGGTTHACWRAMQNPERFVDPRKSVVVDSVVYFLPLNVIDAPPDPDLIMSFDLGSEEWRGNITGPISGDTNAVKRYHSRWDQLSLAELNGSLVLVYYHRHPYAMDLWFLAENGNGTWVKKYSIRIVRNPIYGFHVKPLLMLGDGRLLLYQIPIGKLEIYNPETNITEDVQMRLLDSIGMFTGSLLSIQQGDMV